MREQMMQALAQILANNVGNKITMEMANGIAVTFNQVWEQAEQEATKDEEASSKPAGSKT